MLCAGRRIKLRPDPGAVNRPSYPGIAPIFPRRASTWTLTKRLENFLEPLAQARVRPHRYPTAFWFHALPGLTFMRPATTLACLLAAAATGAVTARLATPSPADPTPVRTLAAQTAEFAA